MLAEGSLQNKVFPAERDFLQSLQGGLQRCCKENGLPSIPRSQCANLGQAFWSHTSNITQHITRNSIQLLESHFQGAIFHCEDKHASSLRIFCPCLYYQAIDNTFLDPAVFSTLVSVLDSSLGDKFGKSYPRAIGKGCQLPSGYILAKRKKHYESGRPIISFVDSPFRPILARMTFQFIPVACPLHFATGDVYHLFSILRQAPEHGDLKLYNQDLAGFFTSIDQKRFIGA